MNNLSMNMKEIELTAKWFTTVTNDLLILLNQEGQIEYINPSFERAMQYSLSEIKNQSYLTFVHEQDREHTFEHIELLKKDQFIPFINRYKRKDGTYYRLHWVMMAVSGSGYIQGVAKPIEYSNNHGKVLSTRTWYNSFYGYSGEAAHMFDLEGRVIAANTAFEKLFGWTAEEIIGKELEIIPPDRQYEFDQAKEEVLNGSRIVNFQTLRVKKDGTIFPVSVTYSKICDDSGEIVALSAIIKDLTELVNTQKIVEQQSEFMAEQEKLLKNISDNINEIVCLYDIQMGKYVYISPSYERVWGFDLQEVYKDANVIFDTVYEEDIDQVRAFFLTPHHYTAELEYRIVTNSGEVKWIRTKITPVKDNDGTIVRYLSISEDVSELKESELLIKKSDKLGVVGQLAAGIAHEIRNPLTAVKGFLQLLNQETKTKYADIILTELERIEFIMNEFLMLAKPHEEMKMEEKSVLDVLKEVITFMGPEAILNQVEIITEFTDEPLMVICEQKQLKQVFINLIKNAIEAIPSGGQIFIRTMVKSNGFVCIEVEDNGIGISKERIERLGEPFYSSKEKGTGLGLVVSFKIIENHKGTIQISSEEGNGTTVQMLLPLVK
ncbi:PAS domain S-box protein [Bacillus sp. Hm123]|uniref:PAS domain S-box protein n=1 Tax=Bacillus sp. Hm123 TaxID=3450745 RepID=UPI003F42155D